MTFRKMCGNIAAGFFALVAAGCGGEGRVQEMLQFKTLADVPDEALQSVANRSFYFGHQSVGNNIVDGLQVLLAENPSLKINLVAGDSADAVVPGTFLHSEVGRNHEPQTKIEAFEQVLDRGVGSKADAAFVKFCYVDVETRDNSTVDELFANYKRSMKSLQAKYPDATFIHFTMPLHAVPTGWKVKIKDLLGREIPQYRANAERNHFNELLRQTYAGKEPLFDIAYLESVVPGTGRRATFSYDGRRLDAMAPENTNDGGHLNEMGKRWIAEQLLIFLAELEYNTEGAADEAPRDS